MTERQELHCHACQKYVQFDLDLELNGNHVLECPNCSHEHCRVVENGQITGDRWDQRNGAVPVSTSSMTWTTTSSWATYTSGTPTTYSTSAATSNTDSSGQVFLYQSWMDTLAC